jgi:hypothetical protein
VHTRFYWGNLREVNHLEDLRVNERIILKWAFEKRDGKAWNGLIWQGQVAGYCE